jgi:hypothetical protein
MYATQLNHLLQRGAHATSLAAVLIARPNAEEREAKGQLALLLEVPGNSARLQVAANEFLKHVEAAYYNGPAMEPEASLEQALRQANAGLGAVAGLLDKRWPEKTTMVVFVHHGDQVFFATAGSAWGVLLTPQRVASITDSGNRHANVNPLKPFSAISSGPLQPDSVACFASLTLLDYIAQEKFRKLVWELPPLGVVQRLEELLSQASPQLNIMALMKHDHPNKFGLGKCASSEELLGLYDEQVQKIYELRQKKNRDYGEAWRDMRISSINDLILMKLLRIKQIETNAGATLVSEPIESGFQDIANYALFAMVLNEEGVNIMK